MSCWVTVPAAPAPTCAFGVQLSLEGSHGARLITAPTMKEPPVVRHWPDSPVPVEFAPWNSPESSYAQSCFHRPLLQFLRSTLPLAGWPSMHIPPDGGDVVMSCEPDRTME